jgi:hypothetical protein
MTKDECISRLKTAQKNKKELRKIKLQLLKEIEQLKLMLRALEEEEEEEDDERKYWTSKLMLRALEEEEQWAN